MVQLLKSILIRVVPAGFVLGGCMELFMIKTGFYNTALRLEAERRATFDDQMERQSKRVEELKKKGIVSDSIK